MANWLQRSCYFKSSITPEFKISPSAQGGWVSSVSRSTCIHEGTVHVEGLTDI